MTSIKNYLIDIFDSITSQAEKTHGNIKFNANVIYSINKVNKKKKIKS